MSWQGAGWALGLLAAAFVALPATALAKVVLWSSMKGRVLLNGQPATGAVLVRTCDWAWGNKEFSDRVTAGAEGEFAFPAILGRMVLGTLLPHEPVIEQATVVEYQGMSYRAWNSFRRGYRHDSENDGRPIDVACRPDAERAQHGRVVGLCVCE